MTFTPDDVRRRIMARWPDKDVDPDYVIAQLTNRTPEEIAEEWNDQARRALEDMHLQTIDVDQE